MKPDIVIAGDGIPIDENGELKRIGGTSFASPTAAGIGALLIDLYKAKQKGKAGPATLPTSAEIKALLVHTSKDPAPLGPDPKFGWGVVDPVPAADVATGLSNGAGALFKVGEVARGKRVEFAYPPRRVAIPPARATLVWIDPQAPPNHHEIDDPTPTLVNDLDLEFVAPAPDRTIFQPYQLRRPDPRRREETRAAPLEEATPTGRTRWTPSR